VEEDKEKICYLREILPLYKKREERKKILRKKGQFYNFIFP